MTSITVNEGKEDWKSKEGSHHFLDCRVSRRMLLLYFEGKAKQGNNDDDEKGEERRGIRKAELYHNNNFVFNQRFCTDFNETFNERM